MPRKIPATTLLSVGAIFAAGLVGATAWTQNKEAAKRAEAYRMDYMARVSEYRFDDYVKYWRTPEIIDELNRKTSVQQAKIDDTLTGEDLEDAMRNFQWRGTALWSIEAEKSLPHFFDLALQTRNLKHAQYSSYIPWCFMYYPHNTEKIIEFGISKWPTATKVEKYVIKDWSDMTYSKNSPPLDSKLFQQWLQTSTKRILSVGRSYQVYEDGFLDPQLLAAWSKGQNIDLVLGWLKSKDIDQRRYAVRFATGMTTSMDGYDQALSALESAKTDPDEEIRQTASDFLWVKKRKEKNHDTSTIRSRFSEQ